MAYRGIGEYHVCRASFGRPPMRMSRRLLLTAVVLSAPLSPVRADSTRIEFTSAEDVGLAVGRVSSAYAELTACPDGRGTAMTLLFVGGPRAAARPAVFLAARPAGSLPSDWTRALGVRLRVYNPGPALLSLEIEVRTSGGNYARHAMLSAGHWRTVALDTRALRDAGADLATVQGMALRPSADQAGRLSEILVDRIVVDWDGPAPCLAPVAPRERVLGPAAAIAAELGDLGFLRWCGMRVPVAAEADVLVAGGGLAGVAAAVAAARQGARVILVEQSGVVGGMATSGYVPPAMRTELAGGLVGEFAAALDECGGPDQQRHPEVMKAVLLALLRGCGARLLLYTTAVAPVMDGRRVTGLVVHSKAGFQALRAPIVIDCTGDADIAARAGAPFQIGRGRDPLTQTMTLMFLLGNVDTDQFPGAHRGGSTQPYVDVAKAEGNFSLRFAGGAYCEKVISGPHGVINVNCVNVGGVDPLSPADLTYAHVQAFDVAWQLVDFFRRYVPGCEECYLVSSASYVGVRESRRVVGEYLLTARDVLGAAGFEDGIARGFYPVDIHGADNTGDAAGAHLRAPYEIPYRCLVPKGVEGLLVAGRPISADHVAHGSLRVMGTTMALGEAAGTAAALCHQRGVSPRQLDGREVRAQLERAGALPQAWQRVEDNPALRAKGTAALADSCHPSYPDSAEGAIDGLVGVGSDSRWVSGEGEEPHWLELQFPRATTVSAVTLYFWPPGGQGTETSYVPREVQIQARLDGEWRPLASAEPDAVTVRVPFGAVTTHRLRLWFPRGSRADGIIRLREVTVASPGQSSDQGPAGR